MTTLNELAAQIHAISSSKGFWDGTICENKYCQTRRPRHPAESLLLIVSEATEAYEAVRDGMAIDDDATEWRSGPNTPGHTMERNHQGLFLTSVEGNAVHPPMPVTDDVYRQLNFEGKPVGVPQEIADIVIRALDFAAANGIDLDAVVARKLAYNANRPHMHGRKA